MSKVVNAILFKKINNGDLWNIDRPKGSVAGGGGQTYINTAIDAEDLDEFMSGAISAIPKPSHSLGNKTYIINAKSIHDSNQTGEITFDPRSNRSDYAIVRQALHQNRHPAWLNANSGFPVINPGASSAVTVTTAADLKIFILRTTDNEYYAGFVNSATRPTNWPDLPEIERIFNEESGIAFLEETSLNPSSLALYDSMKNNTNILLYGPPGTGKTYAMQNLWKDINEIRNLYLNENNLTNPFTYDNIPEFRRIRREWVTFHQNYSYEEFVLGKQVIPISGGGFTLKPKLGIFMDVAASINPRNEFESAIIFIDELNRGNVSRVFGQLITFLEGDKREHNKSGEENLMKLPIPLNDLLLVGDETEDILSLDGSNIKLPVPYYLPYPIYIVASMNSVDRAVAPLDSALARRFTKIEYNTDYKVLSDILEINVSTINYTTPSSWDAAITAYLLLKKINDLITAYFGKDFELGHVHLLPLQYAQSETEKILKLRECWEGTIYPQISSLLTNRNEILIELLKVDMPVLPAFYPYKYRSTSISHLRILDSTNTFDLDAPDKILEVFRIIAQ